MELAFATQDDVFEVNERVLHSIFTEFSDKKTDDIPLKEFHTEKPWINMVLISRIYVIH